MADDFEEALQRSLDRRQVLYDRLAVIPEVKPHDSPFEGELTLVAPSSAEAAVRAVVEEVAGQPAKAAGAEVSDEQREDPLLEALGGVRKEQTLYLQDLEHDICLYVMFWPWGGGARFTIKIGVLAPAD